MCVIPSDPYLSKSCTQHVHQCIGAYHARGIQTSCWTMQLITSEWKLVWWFSSPLQCSNVGLSNCQSKAASIVSPWIRVLRSPWQTYVCLENPYPLWPPVGVRAGRIIVFLSQIHQVVWRKVWTANRIKITSDLHWCTITFAAPSLECNRHAWNHSFDLQSIAPHCPTSQRISLRYQTKLSVVRL